MGLEIVETFLGSRLQQPLDLGLAEPPETE
jgi:hypothetical protein